MTNQDELLIINKVLSGDRDAFGILVDRYQALAYTIAIRLLEDPEEAADIVQEAFIKSYEVLDTFRGDAKFSTWIYRIVYRKSLDRLKAIKRRRTDSFENVGEPVMDNSEGNASELMMVAERKELVKEAIAKLKPEEQTLILLYYFEESSIKEISEILDMGMENVKVRLFRTRKKLFNLLKGRIDHIKI